MKRNVAIVTAGAVLVIGTAAGASAAAASSLETSPDTKATIAQVSSALTAAEVGYDGLGLSPDGETFEVLVYEASDIPAAKAIAESIVTELPVSVSIVEFGPNYDPDSETIFGEVPSYFFVWGPQTVVSP